MTVNSQHKSVSKSQGKISSKLDSVIYAYLQRQTRLYTDEYTDFILVISNLQMLMPLLCLKVTIIYFSTLVTVEKKPN